MGDDDLIRRGDALKALDWGDIYGRNAQASIRAIPAADARAEVLKEAAAVAERFGPNRPLVALQPKDRIIGRWEGEQAASAGIAAAILALITEKQP